MKTYSQCHQDLATLALLGDGRRFLDIGSSCPDSMSNTYLLEQHGWTGICIDKQCHDYGNRSALFIQGDAISALRECLSGHFHYVSFDVDDDTVDALRTFLASGLSFTFATVEHDKYRLGEGPQEDQHEMLRRHGYVPMFTDIHPTWNDSIVFEDWWCDMSVCDRTLGSGLSSADALGIAKTLTGVSHRE